MAKVLERSLYKTDYYAWTKQQAAVLRAMAARGESSTLDLENLAEEVESLGRSDLNTVRSQVRRIIEHLLKLEFSPSTPPRADWRYSVAEARDEVEDHITASMRADVAADLGRLFERARRASPAWQAGGRASSAADVSLQPRPDHQPRLASKEPSRHRRRPRGHGLTFGGERRRREPSQLVYFETATFSHAITDTLFALAPGFHRLSSRPGGGAIDYSRSNLFDLEKVIALPHDLPGMDNDLSDLLESRVNRAMADPEAMTYAFGERWGPEGQRDQVFGFAPGNGVHDIHMNQGHVGRFVGDDGVWQDGAFLLHHPAENRWSALFLAFQAQALHTDDETGHALPGARRFEDVVRGTVPDEHEFNDGVVRIVGALVNPAGHDPGLESVTLLNVSPEPIDLAGWQIANRNDDRFTIGAVLIDAGQTARIALPTDVAPLGNKGGEISLLDRQEARVHGVAFTRAQADRQGWTVAF